jgi:hypothetical protein
VAAVGAALLLLRRRARLPLSGDVRSAQRQLYWRMVRAFADARNTAAEAAFGRTNEELRLYLPQGYTRISREVRSVETARVTRAARGYATRWGESAAESGSFRVATSEAAPMLRTAARTEASHAFTYARDQVLSSIHTDILYKVWDSILDAQRTCRVCSRAHGTVVRLHEQFPQGMPGGVHPNCMCSEQILPAWLIDSDDMERLMAS